MPEKSSEMEIYCGIFCKMSIFRFSAEKLIVTCIFVRCQSEQQLQLQCDTDPVGVNALYEVWQKRPILSMALNGLGLTEWDWKLDLCAAPSLHRNSGALREN